MVKSTKAVKYYTYDPIYSLPWVYFKDKNIMYNIYYYAMYELYTYECKYGIMWYFIAPLTQWSNKKLQIYLKEIKKKNISA